MSAPAFHSLWLLAVRLPGGHVWGRFDHERPRLDAGEMFPVAIAAITLVVTALAAYWLARRNKSHFWENSSPRLFIELCRTHGLSAKSRRLVKQVAAARGLADPALVFLDPRHFDANSLPPELQRSGSDLQKLRGRLFS